MASNASEADPEREDIDRDPISQNEDMIIDLSDLLPGDILLFHSLSQKAPAKQISNATGTPYTHAAIFIGDNEIAESTWPRVQIRKLSGADIEGTRIGVLRSQMVFSDRRAKAIRDFTEHLVSQNAMYDLTGVLKFSGRKRQLYENLIKEIAANYGQVSSIDELQKQSYFCSALVVACYIVAGVIGDTAQAVYPPNVISPGDLHRDPTFGWLLGYIVPDGETIPSDDPLTSSTVKGGAKRGHWAGVK